MHKFIPVFLVLLALPLATIAQEVPGHPDVWVSAGTKVATPAEIQALIATPGPAVDQYSIRCRVIIPSWGHGTPADEAAGKLVEIGSPAVESLLPLLTSKEAWRRCLTADILGRIGDRRAVLPLASLLLSDAEENVRRSSATSLAMLRDERAEEAFLNAIQDKSNYVQQTVIAGLGRLKTPRAISTLISLLSLLADTSAPNYREALWKAGIASSALNESGMKAFQPLLKIINRRETPPTTLALALSPASAVGDKRVVPVLLRLTNHPADEVREAAVYNLIRWHDPRAIPAAAKVLNGSPGRAQYTAARLLAWEGGKRSLEILEKASNATDETVRTAAASAYDVFSTNSAVPMLIRVLRTGNTETAPAAAMALGRLQDANAIPDLAVAAASKETSLRIAVVNALGRFDTPQSISPLLTALTDTESEVRRKALIALRHKHDPRILPAVEPLSKDSDPSIQSHAFLVVRILQNERVAKKQ